MFFLCVSDHLYHHFVDIPPVSAGVSYQCGAAAARWQGGRGDLIQLSYGNVTTFDMGGRVTQARINLDCKPWDCHFTETRHGIMIKLKDRIYWFQAPMKCI